MCKKLPLFVILSIGLFLLTGCSIKTENDLSRFQSLLDGIVSEMGDMNYKQQQEVTSGGYTSSNLNWTKAEDYKNIETLVRIKEKNIDLLSLKEKSHKERELMLRNVVNRLYDFQNQKKISNILTQTIEEFKQIINEKINLDILDYNQSIELLNTKIGYLDFLIENNDYFTVKYGSLNFFSKEKLYEHQTLFDKVTKVQNGYLDFYYGTYQKLGDDLDKRVENLVNSMK